MNTWRGAWHIFKYDMKRDRYGFIFNILFYTYLVVVMMPLANLGKDSPNIYWLKDALYFSVLPNMGYIFSKNIFRYWSDDTFSRKLLLYRTLPITAKQFVAARFFNLMVTMLLGWLYFFGLQYMLTSIFFDAPNLAAYAGQALFWLGYATIMGVTYVYWELCHSGKVFVIATLPYFLFLRSACISVLCIRILGYPAYLR